MQKKVKSEYFLAPNDPLQWKEMAHSLLPQGAFWKKDQCPIEDELEVLLAVWSSSFCSLEKETRSIFLDCITRSKESGDGFLSFVMDEMLQDKAEIISFEMPYPDAWSFGDNLGVPIPSLAWVFVIDVILNTKTHNQNEVKEAMIQKKLTNYWLRFFDA